MPEWNCTGYRANISDRQCLINREVRRHRDPKYICLDCRRGRDLAQRLPDLAAAIGAQYGTSSMLRKLSGQDKGGRF